MLVLREGAAKRVPGPRLVAALREESRRLARAREVLEDAGLLPVRTDEIAEVLRTLSVFQAAGVEPGTIASILDATDDLDRGIAALSAIAGVVSIQPIEEGLATDLGLALTESALTPATYASVSSAYLRGTLSGVTGETAIRIIIDVLRRGGGLIQIDRELKARGRRR